MAANPIVKAAAAGASVSVALFLVSWWAHLSDELLIPQFPGFCIASLFWGMPGFPHYVPKHRGVFLFPYVMIVVNTVFYGLLAYGVMRLLRRTARVER